MAFFWRIVLGIIVAAVGFMMIYKTTVFFGWSGRIAWAEQKLGPGGTRTFLKLFGLGLIFLGIFIMTGIINDIMSGLATFVT